MVASTSPAGHRIMYRDWLFNPSTAILSETQRGKRLVPTRKGRLKGHLSSALCFSSHIAMFKMRTKVWRGKFQGKRWNDRGCFNLQILAIWKWSSCWDGCSAFPREDGKTEDLFKFRKLTIVPGATSKQWDWSTHGPASWGIYGTINHNGSFSLCTGKRDWRLCVCVFVHVWWLAVGGL